MAPHTHMQEFLFSKYVKRGVSLKCMPIIILEVLDNRVRQEKIKSQELEIKLPVFTVNFIDYIKIQNSGAPGQSVKHLTLHFSTGHDLTVHGFQPYIRFHTDNMETACNSHSPFLSLPLPHPTPYSHVLISL